MFIRREWRLGCRCPRCGGLLAPLVSVQEQVYPERSLPEMAAPAFLSPTLFGMSAEHRRCGPCHAVFEAGELDLFLELVPAADGA